MNDDDLYKLVEKQNQKIQTLESEIKLVDTKLRRTQKRLHKQNIRQDRDLDYLKKILLGVILCIGIWFIASDRVKSSTISDDNLGLILQIIGLVLGGGVGVTAINQTQHKHSENNDDSEEDDT